jgi:outer membrane protein
LKTKFAVVPALALGAVLAVQAQPAPIKVGIIHIQNTILSTKDGQKAAAELQARFAPKKAELDKKQGEIAAMQDTFRKGGATMSEDKKQQLMRDIDSRTKALNRDTEDAQTELDQEQGKLMQELGGRIMAVVEKYARDNGYAVILDVSNPQTPVLWAANGIDITNDIVALYDKNSPTATPAAVPKLPSPMTPRPAVTPSPKAAPKKN